MRKRHLLIFAASAALALSGPAYADEVDGAPIYVPPQEPMAAAAPPADPNEFRVYWQDGLRMETASKAFKLKIGGRIYADLGWNREDGDLENAFGSSDNGFEFRSARLYMAGIIYDRVIFKAGYDFAGGDADFKDVYVGLRKLPWLGTLKIGHFKEPFSLEQITSSRYITFMERSLADALVPGRNSGVAIANTYLDQRLWFGLGGFYESDDFGDSGTDKWNLTTRLAGTAWQSGDDMLLHLGASYRYSDLNNVTGVRRRQRPEAHLINRYVDTRVNPPLGDPGDSGDDVDTLCGPTGFNPGGGSCRNSQTVGAELAGVFGPFSIQGEWVGSWFDQKDVKNPFLNGWYAYGSWFITGEHRTYSAKHAAFTRVRPNGNFLQDGGTGAVEIAVRYSTLRLDSEIARGGNERGLTVGLNWYLNPNTRMMMNYIHADVESPLNGVNDFDQADADIFQMRFQIDF